MAESRLFAPLKIGKVELQHRVVMAPLTRYRASDEHIPLPFVKDYYGQRASVPGTLLITEGTLISPQGGGNSNAPGIWNLDQIKAWKEVTETVHSKGSFIYLQLWAIGRAADPSVLKKEGPYDVVSSSAIPLPSAANQPAATPRPLRLSEIEQWVADYAQAAKNAVEAGFDGVEIHGANGYLVDQFIQDNVNQRTDEYGGSIANRSQFALEVAQAVVKAVGADRTAIRLSPWSTFQGMRMRDPIPQFSHLIEGLKKLKLSYLHLVEARVSGSTDSGAKESLGFALDIWDQTSPVLLAGGYAPDSAKRAVDEQYPDKDVAIVFGRHFIPNPDLPFRVKNNIELRQYDRSIFYFPKQERGYIDYSFSEEFKVAAQI